MGANPTADIFRASAKKGDMRETEWEKKMLAVMTVWPSGLRRWLKAPFRKGVGSNPTAVIRYDLRHPMHMCWHMEGGPHGLVNRRDNVQGDLCSQCSKSGDLRWDKKACVTATAQFVP